ncbi:MULTISPECIES: hypothetical protein [unclassified Bradyrhizobium]
MPVDLAHTASIDLDKCRSDVGRNRKVAGVGDAYAATRRRHWRQLHQLEHHVLPHMRARAIDGILCKRRRDLTPEDEQFLSGYPIEGRRGESEVFGQPPPPARIILRLGNLISEP